MCILKDIQLERLKSRDHIETDLALKIIAKQLPIDLKKTKSQFVVDNSKDLETLKNNFNIFAQGTLNS